MFTVHKDKVVRRPMSSFLEVFLVAVGVRRL
jgi:hypothetical protein